MKLVGQRDDLRGLLTPLVRFAMESEYRSLPEVFSGDQPDSSPARISRSITRSSRVLITKTRTSESWE